MKEELDALDLAERFEKEGDAAAVSFWLSLAKERDGAVAGTARYQGLQERLESFLARRRFLLGGAVCFRSRSRPS